MRQSKAKSLRRILNLPRHPSKMDAPDRMFYRAVKKAYSHTPRPQREAYLDHAAMVRKAIMARFNTVNPQSA